MEVTMKKSADKQLKKLAKNVQEKISKHLEATVRHVNDFSQIKSEKLKGTNDRYKIRVGSYRVVIKKISNTQVQITAIADRKDIYKLLLGITI